MSGARGTAPWRLFVPAASVTVLTVGLLALFAGFAGAAVSVVLIGIEVAFSFDNAVVNAKIIGELPPFWRRLFLTFGMAIAVLGMRVVFPILLVMLTTHQSWGRVVHLALHLPQQYAAALNLAHPMIAAFGGTFLLMLALQFFFGGQRDVLWLGRVERPLRRISWPGSPMLATFGLLAFAVLLPANAHSRQMLLAGSLGVLAYVVIHVAMRALGRRSGSRSALSTFVYLEMLDASFSLDGVLGAFAVTNKLLLITIGLGVGAVWVRSLTIFMAERDVLRRYIYLEHGAHYTIAVLGVLLLASVIWDVPDVIAGLAGIGLIGSAAVSSRRVRTAN